MNIRDEKHRFSYIQGYYTSLVLQLYLNYPTNHNRIPIIYRSTLRIQIRILIFYYYENPEQIPDGLILVKGNLQSAD